LRVLQVMECTIGGTRRHLRDVVHGLLRRGVEVEVACAALREPRMTEDMAAMRAAGATVHALPMVRRISPPRDAWHALRLAGVLLDRRFDVIHTHSSKAGALGRAAGLLCSGAVRVHTPHTFAFSFTEGRAGQGGESVGPVGAVLATERLLGRWTHAMVHVSASERDEGQGFRVIRPERARVVPNGIDPEPFEQAARGNGGRAALRAAARRELGLADGARVVGGVGLLNDAKGFDVLVAAAPLLPPDVQLLVVGHGERDEELRRQAGELGVAERVRFTGWRDDLPRLHAAMDVFALPSRWEGLPYALLEALASGLPCVSTDVNGSRDVLAADPACGLLVPREDPPALAAALTRLLDDAPLRQRFAALGPPRVRAAFTVDGMVDGLLALYLELLGRAA